MDEQLSSIVMIPFEEINNQQNKIDRLDREYKEIEHKKK